MRTLIKATENEKETRRQIEQTKEAIITNSEENEKKDTLRFSASGLTPVLARIAAKKGSAWGIDINQIKKKEKKEKAMHLTRVRQNIFLARKAKLSLAMRDSTKEGKYVLLSIGASTQQLKEASAQSF